MELYQLLPRKALIASTPLRLSAGQERLLDEELAQQLTGVPNFDTLLMRVYSDIANEDPAFTGFVHFHQLSSHFGLNQLYLPPPLLRLLASMFVGPDGTHVNYERLLAFLGATHKRLMGGPGGGVTPRGGPAVPPLFQSAPAPATATSELPEDGAPNGEPFSEPVSQVAIARSSEEGGEGGSATQRVTASNAVGGGPLSEDAEVAFFRECALHQISTAKPRLPWNLDALRSALRVADWSHTGKLGLQQILEVCEANRLPLEEWLLERIANKCASYGTGMYNWADFIRALEHIVPHSFGWAPSDQLPDPASNGAPAPAITPRAITNQPPPFAENKYPRGGHELIVGRPPAGILTSPRGQDPLNMGSGSPSGAWADRFMQFSQRLREKDADKSGLLTTLECLRLSREVNDELRLGFSDLDLENMMRHSRATDGRVSISRYLQELAKIRSYYR